MSARGAGDEILVGVLADTHGLVRPEALAALAGAALILHAGDVGAPEVLEALARVAPVRAVRGNVDHGAWARRLPASDQIAIGRLRIHLLHDLSALDLDPRAARVAAVVAGHSHRPRADSRDGVLYFNPGSAGPRRFSLPVSVGRLTVRGTTITPELITLDA